jgi:hypothetical protein
VRSVKRECSDGRQDRLAATLDDAAFAAASDVAPNFVPASDPAAQWTARCAGRRLFAFSTNAQNHGRDAHFLRIATAPRVASNRRSELAVESLCYASTLDGE